MIRGMPYGKRFEHCTFENFEVTEKNQEAFSACRRVAEAGKVGVLIMGKNGLGKTHLLVAMMKEYDRRRSSPPNQATKQDLIAIPPVEELVRDAGEARDTGFPPALTADEIERQVVVEYWPLLDLTSELRSEVAHGSLEVSRRCRECDLLVLDDFGAERVTDFVLEELERIVDWRYRLMKLTAIATNLSDFRRITQKYGQRTISRWFGSCEVVKILGDDRRATMEPS
ncbi:MAG: DnaA/Hda family protein [Thermotogota bacterium]